VKRGSLVERVRDAQDYECHARAAILEIAEFIGELPWDTSAAIIVALLKQEAQP
jgi:hypothetical protein